MQFNWAFYILLSNLMFGENTWKKMSMLKRQEEEMHGSWGHISASKWTTSHWALPSMILPLHIYFRLMQKNPHEFSSTLFEIWKPIMRTTDIFYYILFSKLLFCKAMPCENLLLMTSHSLNYSFNIYFPLVSKVCFLKRRNNLGLMRNKPLMSWAQFFSICHMFFKKISREF